MKSKKYDSIDEHYVGNVFGWKASIAAAILIVTLILLAVWGQYNSDKPFQLQVTEEGITQDSTTTTVE